MVFWWWAPNLMCPLVLQQSSATSAIVNYRNMKYAQKNNVCIILMTPPQTILDHEENWGQTNFLRPHTWELGKAFLGYWECIHRNQSGKIHTAFKTTLIPSWLRLGLICCEFELSLNETDFDLNFKFESIFDLFKFELTDLFELKLTPPFSKVNWIELHCGGGWS